MKALILVGLGLQTIGMGYWAFDYWQSTTLPRKLVDLDVAKLLWEIELGKHIDKYTGKIPRLLGKKYLRRLLGLTNHSELTGYVGIRQGFLKFFLALTILGLLIQFITYFVWQ